MGPLGMARATCYYRCTASEAYRFGGQRLCRNKQIRSDTLDAAVWEDVRRLLSEPERVRTEYERRLHGPEIRFEVTVARPHARLASRLLARLCRTGLVTRRVSSKGFTL